MPRLTPEIALRRYPAVLAALLMLLMGGCARVPQEGPDPAAAALQSGAPVLTRNSLIADDGRALPLHVWQPQASQPPKAVILALHGFNDYSHAFAMPGYDWAGHGFVTYAWDQRGFGANPDAGLWAGSWRMCRDLHDAVQAARQKWPGLPVYAAGESMGGAIVLAAYGSDCGGATSRPDGLILIAPAVWGRTTMPLINRVSLWVSIRLFPDETFTGRGFGVLASNNFPMLRQLGRDPLFIKATRVRAIFGLVDSMDEGYAVQALPDLPVLLLYGAHDELIPPKAMRPLARHLTQSPRSHTRLAFYPQGWHMLLRDHEHQLVADDVAAWILDHNAKLPSGADLSAPDFLSGKLPRPKPNWLQRLLSHL